LSHESLLEVGLVGEVFGQFNQALALNKFLLVDKGLSFSLKLGGFADQHV